MIVAIDIHQADEEITKLKNWLSEKNIDAWRAMRCTWNQTRRDLLAKMN
jgi:hypothetical protein